MRKRKKQTNKMNKGVFKNKLSFAFMTLNLVLLIMNIFIGGYNIIKSKKELKALDNDVAKMKIDFIKQSPLFEVQYIEARFHVLKSINNGNLDSLYSNPFKNYYLVKNSVYHYLNRQSESLTTIALAIKQIGGSIAKDVEIEYRNITSLKGISYSFSTGDDVASLIDTKTDIAGNKVMQKECNIKYGDIPTGRGLIIPLLSLEDSSYDTIQYDHNGHEIWAITNTDIFIPIKLSFKNIYDEKINEASIRNMNNSIISTYWDIDIRG